MEYANCGELFTKIVTKKKLAEEEASYYYVQLILGLEIIHKKRIVHRDIKPENLLLKDNNILTIIDFGLSNQYKNGEMLSTPCGSPCYAAPEMILGKKYNGLLVDLWSSGIVLYAMVCGYLPFEDKNNDKLYKKILNGRFELPDYLSQDCKDLLLKILVVNPNKRYNLEQIKVHPFLKEAFIKYHISEYEEKTKFCEPVIDKMVNYMPGFNFKREEIIANLINNKHNTITTTYALLMKKFQKHNSIFTSSGIQDTLATDSRQSISSNTTTSPNKLDDGKTKINIIQTSIAKTSNNKSNTNKEEYGVTTTLRDPKYSRHYNKNLNTNSHGNKTSDSYKNYSTFCKRKGKGKYKGKESKNDISVSLDVSKIIKKNKIDSNIIICVPKLVPINKKLFPNHNKFYYKIAALNNEYKNNYNKYSNRTLFSKRQNNSSKNNTVNTSVTYENSPCKLYNTSKEKSKNKKMVYVKSNTINLLEEKNINSNSRIAISNNSTLKNINQSSYYNASPSSFKSLNSNQISIHYNNNEPYIRSLSVNSQKIQNVNYSQSSICHYQSNSSQKDLMTRSLMDSACKDNNHNVSSVTISYSRANKKSTPTNKQKIQKNSNKLNTQHQKKNIINSNKKTKNITSKVRKETSPKKQQNVKKTKCSSPTSMKKTIDSKNSKSNYCPSFTESITPANLDKGLFKNTSKLSNLSAGINHNNLLNSVKNQKTINKKQAEIYITIKSEASGHLKKEIKNRPITPYNQQIIKEKASSSKKNSSINEKKNIKTKPTVVVDIDIAEDNISVSSKKKNKTPKRSSASSSQKSIKSAKVPSKVIKVKSTSKQKKKKIHTHNIGIVDLSNDDCINKKTKIKKENKIAPPPEIQFNLEEDTETKNKIITTSKDFALCTTTLNMEQIYEKLVILCKNNGLTLTKIDNMKYICKKDSDNSINIEVSIVGQNTVLKLYHLNGQESITKEMIKKIIITIGF